MTSVPDTFVTSSDVTTQDTDYVMTTTGWKVLTLPGGGMTQVIHDTTLTGQGNADNSKLGVAWSTLSGNTIASANSATVAANLGTSSFADITGAINAKADATAISDMLTKTEASQTYQTIAGMSDYLTTTVASQTYQTIAGMSNYLTTTLASQTYLDKTTYATDSATYVTSSTTAITGTKQYALTTTGWAEVQAGSTFTGVTTTGSVSGGGVNNYAIGLLTSAENALTAVDNKVNKPDTTQTDLNNNYLIYSTLTGAGTTTGWMPLSANYYSKSEANGTFVATANIDTTTLSGDGKSVSTKLGVKTDIIATRDYVNSSFLPTSGGTVSGELIVSAATATFDNSYIKCVNDGNAGYSRFGVGSYGGAVIKAVDGNNNNIQVNVKYNANNNELVQIQKGGTDIGFLIPAVTSTTTAGLTDDGILHIILES